MTVFTQTNIVGGGYRETARAFGLSDDQKFPKNTVFGFDVDQTLIDSKLDLGSGPFYSHLRKTCTELESDGYRFTTEHLREKVRLLILKKVPHETEAGLPEFIECLIKNRIGARSQV